jgi:hypothetical protein
MRGIAWELMAATIVGSCAALIAIDVLDVLIVGWLFAFSASP